MKTGLALAVLAAAIAAGTASSAPSGVRVRISNEMAAFYIEGYVSFAKLDHTQARRVNGSSIVLRAGPARHVLHVFIRPCDGNCSYLDPPVKRCSAVVRRGQTATYHLRDQGCSITVRD